MGGLIALALLIALIFPIASIVALVLSAGARNRLGALEARLAAIETARIGGADRLEVRLTALEAAVRGAGGSAPAAPASPSPTEERSAAEQSEEGDMAAASAAPAPHSTPPASVGTAASDSSSSSPAEEPTADPVVALHLRDFEQRAVAHCATSAFAWFSGFRQRTSSSAASRVRSGRMRRQSSSA